jgi:hypothetical protein
VSGLNPDVKAYFDVEGHFDEEAYFKSVVNWMRREVFESGSFTKEDKHHFITEMLEFLRAKEESLLKESGVGDMSWFMSVSGFSHDKAARLCRIGQVSGAFKAQPGKKGAMWHFRKAKTLAWLQSLEVKNLPYPWR